MTYEGVEAGGDVPDDGDGLALLVQPLRDEGDDDEHDQRHTRRARQEQLVPQLRERGTAVKAAGDPASGGWPASQRAETAAMRAKWGVVGPNGLTFLRLSGVPLTAFLSTQKKKSTAQAPHPTFIVSGSACSRICRTSTLRSSHHRGASAWCAHQSRGPPTPAAPPLTDLYVW